MTAPTLSIIVEKQNWLRVSQFFLCIRTLINRWFCFFTDSITGTAAPRILSPEPQHPKGMGFPPYSYMHARIKSLNAIF